MLPIPLFDIVFISVDGTLKFSFTDFQRVAASCVWLASKLEESPRKARQVIIVFHRMECRRENLPIEHLDLYSKVRLGSQLVLISLCSFVLHRVNLLLVVPK